MSDYPRVPLVRFDPGAASDEAARRVYETMRLRRSVRAFSSQPVPIETIRWIVRCAGTAPSGANKQPWRFVCVRDGAMKSRIRAAAEAEEQAFYARRAPQDWLDDLAHLETGPDKPFLEEAPWLIVVFKLARADDGSKVYYTNESVGIACGMLIAAIHQAGLVTLTHTPSPMGFLAQVLGRPSHERAFLLLPVGYPAEGCEVPDIGRKELDEIMTIV